jgi:hypothetical protein
MESAMADELTRVEIGFEGGLIVSMRLDRAQWGKLEQALGESERGVVSLAAEETTYLVDLGKLCYLKHERHVARVGF